MIITTFDVLRKQMRDNALYDFASGYAICTEAQTAPPIGLVNKYDTARKILNESNIEVNGEKLLKTIHLIADEVVSPTVENITKSYISDITTYYDVKPKIEESLQLLLDAKVLLLTNNNYKITSDLEGKLLEEMNDFAVELFSKKRSLIKYLKEYKIFAPVAAFSDGSDTFKFSVLSDQDDELTVPGGKQLKLTVYSLFNISDGDRQDFIERIKLETQHDKDLMTLIPDNKDFSHIDKLIGDISRYLYMEEKYANESDPAKRQIIRDFSLIREEKEKELRSKIDNAYKHASLIYMFDEHLLNPDTFKGTIGDIQRKLIKNIYTKRLSAQLSESLVPKVFSSRKDSLSRLFSGDDFNFFDGHGNFTGDHLKIVEEINARIKTRYTDGRTLEADFSGAPWGYTFGTIVTALAALFRAGRLSVKFNGDTWFSHEQNGVHDAFTNATKFKSASFKSITATLTAAQKNLAVQLLLDLDIELHTGRKIDWNTNDFDLADAIRFAAEHFIGAITTLNDTVEHFDTLFPNVAAQKTFLQEYAGKVTESNYIEKVERLLAGGDQFKLSIQTILNAQKFIKKNFSRVKDFKRFIEEVAAELKKADRQDNTIRTAHDEFTRLYKQDMVSNFAQLQQQVQVVKDSYYTLIKNAAAGMTHEYQLLAAKVDAAIRELKQNYPAELNKQSLGLLEDLKRYATDRTVKAPELEFSTTCKNCGYSLSDMLNYTALAPSKDNDLLIIQSRFVKEAPRSEPEAGGQGQPSAQKIPRKIKLQVPGKVMTVKVYKSLLTNQLTALAAALPDDEIELNIEVD